MTNTMEADGLVTLPSKFSVRETVDRLAQLATSKGLIVFLRMDHAANGREAGFDLRPTELIVFGNPKGGTPLMLLRQTCGIDLPVKALAWEDEGGNVWLSYNSARSLSERHRLDERAESMVAAIENGLSMLCRAAAAVEIPASSP